MESEDGSLYAVLDYQKGTTLADYVHLQHGLLPEAQAIAVLLQLVEVWENAHKEGVFGGVIHPSYIVLTPDYTLKVEDIALSQFYTRKMIELGDKNNMARLAPEFWQDGTTVDERADIYGLGLLLFELLTAKNLYAHLSLGEMKNKIVSEPLPSPKQFYPLISPATEEIIRKATAKNPQDRYTSCTQLRQALLDWQPAPVEKPTENKQATPLPKPKKEQKPAFDISKYNTVNLMPWLLICSFLALGLLAWRYAGKEKTSKGEIIADIQNEGRIKFFQDSVSKAQAKKAIDDSIKRSVELSKKKVLTEPYMHRVRLGESLERIARRYYVTLDTIKQMNGLTGKEVLKPKTGIKIPVKAIHHLKDKETIEMVGQKYMINPLVIKEVNQLYPRPAKAGEASDPVLFEGKEIVIPLMMPPKEKKS
jgi:serine/threonine protein kinase